MRRPLCLALALLAAPAAVAATEPPAAVACAEDRAVFALPGGERIEVAVELADTPETRARGLMFREHLDPGTGMLFIYETPQPVAFWMRNTLIPLDMVFIDARGEVRHVHEGAVPHDETPVPGALPGDPEPARLMVLEVAAGEADRLGLAPGSRLAHPRLPQQDATLPCE
ncbi:DUF192 domain-containing protein [Paracoccus sp. S-4012]|uniref:DUF192 domain-containing protein n=1 Tax=Paracoccus sp. S-4012 TaxID=2665648 RepID=UPI0012AFF532|nr:DUF192 domain-containing protein [Paracoccus sp. S-4012]MRX50350.1 DUF192 domain-containing protein [Paracoccus sp. S-4012]